LTLNCFIKDFPESTDILTRCLADFDNIILSLLDGYPAGSVVILATLHISAREYYVPTREGIFLTPFWHCSYQEKIRWRTIATTFDLPLDSTTSINHPLSDLISVLPYGVRGIGSTAFEARFFRDASRSCHYTVDCRQRNAVATQCLFFLTHRTFPLFSSFFVRLSRLKTHPWITRRRKRVSGRCIPRVTMPLLTQIGKEETPSQSVQLLLNLRFALYNLPPLLHGATYSHELVELAKSWRRGYLHSLLPGHSANVDKAVKDYLLRASGTNR